METNNMVVCFVVFTQKRKNKLSSWVNIGYLAAALKSLERVQVLVKAYEFNEVDKACSEMKKLRPNVIGLSILQENMNVCIKFANKLKSQTMDLKIIAGNVEPSAKPKMFLNYYPSIDIVIAGEGEETIKELIYLMSSNQPISGCAGIFYRKEGKVIATHPRALIDDLDTIPFPDRSFGDSLSTLYSIVGSRGCNGRCTFCDANTIYKYHKKVYVRERSISNLVDEMQYLIEHYNCQYIVFVDSTFCNSLDHPEYRLEELYDELQSRGIWVLFYLNARVEQIKGEFLRQLMRLQEVGLNGVQIGLESGNAEDLKLYGKYATIEDNYTAIRLLKKYEIPYDCGFINFNPYSTIEKLEDNIAFLRETEHFVTPHFMMTRLSIYSSSPITKKVQADNLYTKNENVPITERYLYNFCSSDIDIIYRSAQKCYSGLHVRDYQWLNNIFVQYKKYGYNDEKYQYYIDKMIFLKHFNKVYSDISIGIFEKIINLVKEGVKDLNLISNILKPDIEIANQKLSNYIKELDILQSELSIILFRKNKLILYR